MNTQITQPASQVDDKNHMEFLTMRAEQLSKENGRLRCQLAGIPKIHSYGQWVY